MVVGFYFKDRKYSGVRNEGAGVSKEKT